MTTILIAGALVAAAYFMGWSRGFDRGVDDTLDAVRQGIASESPWDAQRQAAREGRN